MPKHRRGCRHLYSKNDFPWRTHWREKGCPSLHFRSSLYSLRHVFLTRTTLHRELHWKMTLLKTSTHDARSYLAPLSQRPRRLYFGARYDICLQIFPIRPVLRRGILFHTDPAQRGPLYDGLVIFLYSIHAERHGSNTKICPEWKPTWYSAGIEMRALGEEISNWADNLENRPWKTDVYR